MLRQLPVELLNIIVARDRVQTRCINVIVTGTRSNGALSSQIGWLRIAIIIMFSGNVDRQVALPFLASHLCWPLVTESFLLLLITASSCHLLFLSAGWRLNSPEASRRRIKGLHSSSGWDDKVTANELSLSVEL